LTTRLPLRPLRLYLALLGALLLGQGSGSLALRALGLDDPSLTHGFVNADPLHAMIHIVWGAIMLLLVLRRASYRQIDRLALVFGGFYVGLAFLGVLVYHPFGLLLGPFENTFHFVVGPTVLLLGLWALHSLDREPAPARRPGEVGT
jgi:hypothetical protein